MVQFAFARSRKTGKMVHICQLAHLQGASEYERTKYRDEFECPECLGDMVIAVGEKNQHHFRHKSGQSCITDKKVVDRVNRAGLRLWLRERIAERKKLHIPPLNIPVWQVDLGPDIPHRIIRQLSRNHNGCLQYGDSTDISLVECVVADSNSQFQPDIQAKAANGNQYAIELRSSGDIPKVREGMLQALGVPVLVVDICDADYLLWKASTEHIDKYIDKHTTWEIHPEKEKAWNAARNILREEAASMLQAEEDARRKLRQEAQMLFDINEEDCTPQENEDCGNVISTPRTPSLGNLDFSQNRQVRFNDTRYVRCWHCGEVKPEGGFVMCQYARGLCRECHCDEGVKPKWQ